jgi:hypothetical protein
LVTEKLPRALSKASSNFSPKLVKDLIVENHKDWFEGKCGKSFENLMIISAVFNSISFLRRREAATRQRRRKGRREAVKYNESSTKMTVEIFEIGEGVSVSTDIGASN